MTMADYTSQGLAEKTVMGFPGVHSSLTLFSVASSTLLIQISFS